MAVDTETLKVGDKLILTEDGRTTQLVVWAIQPPGTGATSYASGPHIMAHIRPGGYGITFDRDSYHYPNIERSAE